MEWFESWFDTHYYHILYKNRDDSEAEQFIQNLFGYLKRDKTTKVLDLACGKGRHANFVSSLGYDTTGVDLSAGNIRVAKENEGERLHFFTHDMRKPILDQEFDLVLNLFTSFGYFEKVADNEKVLKSIHSYLAKNGILVIDFMHAGQVIENLVKHEKKEVEGVVFEISKTVQNGFIVKDIVFEDANKKYHYQEKVQALDLDDFKKILHATGFEIVDVFGNYRLESFDKNSDRLILIIKKIGE